MVFLDPSRRGTGLYARVLWPREVADDRVWDTSEMLTSLCAHPRAEDRVLEAIGCSRRDIGLRAVSGAASSGDVG